MREAISRSWCPLIWPAAVNGYKGNTRGAALGSGLSGLTVWVTPEGERDARSISETMDHADIRGLGTAVHRSVAGLPRSSVGDHPEGCPHSGLEDSPSCPRIAFLFQCAEDGSLLKSFSRGVQNPTVYKAAIATIA